MKKLSFSPKKWEIKNEITKELEIQILEKILKKCGRFLKELVIDKNLKLEMNIDVASKILKQCDKLENVDLGYYQFNKRSDLLATKAFVHKFKKMHCTFYPGAEDANDDDLKNLLMLNKTLESLTINPSCNMNGDFLSALPSKTIKKLFLEDSNYEMSFQKIYDVSELFCFYLSFQFYLKILFFV